MGCRMRIAPAAGYVDKHHYEFVTTRPDKSRPVRHVSVYSAFGAFSGKDASISVINSRSICKQTTL